MLAKYYKAVIAFVGVIGVGLAALSSATDFTAVAPTGWSAAIVAAGGAVTYAIAFLVRNKKTVDQIDAALEAGDFTLNDLKSLINSWENK